MSEDPAEALAEAMRVVLVYLTRCHPAMGDGFDTAVAALAAFDAARPVREQTARGMELLRQFWANLEAIDPDTVNIGQARFMLRVMKDKLLAARKAQP